MTIARWGIQTIIVAALALGWGVYLLPPGPLRWAGIAVALFFWLFTVAFFRNPHRVPAGGPDCLIAPADGVVSDIGVVDEPDFIGGRALRVGIFLSVFDVHVNRSPADAEIRWAKYTPGRFLDARHPDATHANEANSLGLECRAPNAGLRLVVRQISGLIARRIVCTHGVGDAVTRGELYGMIRFGSRTELWLPADTPHRLVVAVGSRVKCGETVMIRLGAGDAAPLAPAAPVASGAQP